MKNILIYCLCVLLFVVNGTACKKKPGDDPKPDLAGLLRKTWKAATVRQEGIPTPVYQDPLPSGGTNIINFVTFRMVFRQSEYELTDINGTIRQGQWKLTNNGTRILFDEGSSQEVVWEIIELTGSSLKVRYPNFSTKAGNLTILLELVPV
jgi:hypothetical protein